MIIYKYQLKTEGIQTIKCSKDAKFLSVQLQAGVITLWVMEDTLREKEEYKIGVIGTGHAFDGNMLKQYLGTVQQSVYVWHIFILN